MAHLSLSDKDPIPPGIVRALGLYTSFGLEFNVVPNQNPISDFLDACQINLKLI